MSDVFDADELQELRQTARRLAQHAAIMNAALRAAMSEGLADELTKVWWGSVVQAAVMPDLGALFGEGEG